MKGSRPGQILAVVREARESLVHHLKHGRIYSYETLGMQFEDAGKKTVIRLLESKGCYIAGKPLDQTSGRPRMVQEQNEDEAVEVNKSDKYKLKAGQFPLVCPMCIQSFDRLSAHLWKGCMKGSRPDQIRAVMKKAIQSTVHHLTHGRIYPYGTLALLFDDVSKKTVIRMLESMGSYISGKPAEPPIRLPQMVQEQDENKAMEKDKSDEKDQLLPQMIQEQNEKEDMEKDKSDENDQFTSSLFFRIPQMVQATNEIEPMEEADKSEEKLQLFPEMVHEHNENEAMEEAEDTSDERLPQFILEQKENKAMEEEEENDASVDQYQILTLLVETQNENEAMDKEAEDQSDEKYNILPRFVQTQIEDEAMEKEAEEQADEKYNIYKPSDITGPLARRESEASAKENINYAQEATVIDDLSRSNGTAEKHYRELMSDKICAAARLLLEMAQCNLEASYSRENYSSRVSAASSHSHQMDPATALQKLLKRFPVTINGKPPKKKIRQRLCAIHERRCYKQWKTDQQSLRVQDVMDHYKRRFPLAHQVKSYMKKMQWYRNLPDVRGILLNWKPALTDAWDPADNVIVSLVKHQNWRGLRIAEDPRKGKRVTTSRAFHKGEIACDYHGTVLTAKEGRKMMKRMRNEEMGHLFFFQDPSGTPWCMDAHSHPCSCHPEKETFGRLIRHSRKRFNVKPSVETLTLHGTLQFVIIFITLRDIDVDEEILFNYGYFK